MSNNQPAILRTKQAGVAAKMQPAANWLWRRVIADNSEGFLTVAELRAEYDRRLADIVRAA